MAHPTVSIPARDLDSTHVLVGESGGLSAVYEVEVSSTMPDCLLVSTEHGSLYLERDQPVEVLTDPEVEPGSPFPPGPCPGGPHLYGADGNAVCQIRVLPEPCSRFESAGNGPDGDFEHSMYCRGCGSEFAEHPEART